MDQRQILVADELLKFIAESNSIIDRNQIFNYFCNTKSATTNEYHFALGVLLQKDLIAHWNGRNSCYQITEKGMEASKIGLTAYNRIIENDEKVKDKERKMSYTANQMTIISSIIGLVAATIGFSAHEIWEWLIRMF